MVILCMGSLLLYNLSGVYTQYGPGLIASKLLSWPLWTLSDKKKQHNKRLWTTGSIKALQLTVSQATEKSQLLNFVFQ